MQVAPVRVEMRGGLVQKEQRRRPIALGLQRCGGGEDQPDQREGCGRIDERRGEDEIQKRADRYIAEVEKMLKAKEEDLMAV